MRLYSIHLMAAVTLFTCVEASALESQLEPTLPETSGHTSDQTFPQNGTNSVDEERMPRPNVVRGMRGAAQANDIKLSKARFAEWALKCEKELGLTSSKPLNPNVKSDDLFRNPPSDTWDAYAKTDDYTRKRLKYEMLLRVLLARYDEFDLAKAFHAAMEIDESQNTAEHLQLHLNWYWDATTPSYKDMFVKLGLDPTKDGFLDSPLFKTWHLNGDVYDYRRDSVVVAILKDHLGDFGLAKMLDAAKKVASTKATAIDLEYAYMYEWGSEKPDKVFDRLGLKMERNNLLGIPLFKMWHEYAKEKWSTLEMALFLRARMGDAGFAKMLDAAKKDYSTKAIAIELEKAYTPQWRYDDPNRVFDNLGLDAKSDDLLANPLFKTWCKYMDWNWSLSDVVKKLKNHRGDFIFAEMLDAGKKVDAIFVKLEDAYIHGWDGEHPDRVFNELGLDAKSDGLLGIPLFKTWYVFATQKWSTLKVMTFLKARSDEFGFAKMLEAATKVDDTKTIATKLLEAQFEYWSSSQVSESPKLEQMGLGFLTVSSETLGHHQDPVDPVGSSVWEKYREWRKEHQIKRKRQDQHAHLEDSSLDKKLKATENADGLNDVMPRL